MGYGPGHKFEGELLLCSVGRPGDDKKKLRQNNKHRFVHMRFRHGGNRTVHSEPGAILSMTRSLAAEWGKFGITVNVLSPGWLKTAQNTILYQNKEWLDYIVGRIPLNRVGQPNDLDGTVVFLASDASEYLTGQIILVDGGFTTGATKAIT